MYGFDVFNEAHFRSDDKYTLIVYQKWLEGKYNTIEVLNHAWYRRYESFSQILIDIRKSAYSVWGSLLPDVEYEKFRSENVTDICKFLYDTAKKYDDVHPIIIDGTSSQILYEDVTLRNNDEFKTARIPDIYGATFYPKSWGRNYRETPWTLSMYYSMPAGAATIAKPVVRIAVSYSNRLFFDSLLKWEKSFWSDDVKGWYKLFWSNGIVPEFTDLEDLDEEDMKADMIILPAILSISNEATSKLTTYLDQGGILSADARLGVFNELGNVPKEGIPGVSLSELFGLAEMDVSSGERFILNEKSIPCNYMNQELKVKEGAMVLGTMENGTPAVIYHKFGKGETLYFNSFMGLELKKELYSKVVDTVLNLLLEKDSKIITAKKASSVHMRYIKSEKKKVIILINFSTMQQVIELYNLPLDCTLVNLMTGNTLQTKDKTIINIPENTAYIYSWENITSI